MEQPAALPRPASCHSRPWRLLRRAPSAWRPSAWLLPVVVASSLLSAGCAVLQEPTPAEKGMKPLSGAQVKELLGKARYRWVAARGATGTAITSGDGRVRVMWETGATNGHIRFTETGYCSRFADVRNGVEDCYRLYRSGPNEYTVVRVDGTPSGTIALIQ